MTKDTFEEWDATAANNTDIAGINIAEGMNAADVNNAFREMMAQLAVWLASHGWTGEAASVPSSSLNALTQSGVYRYVSTDTGSPDSVSGQSGVVFHAQRSTGRAIQIAATLTGTVQRAIYYRENNDATWSGWRQFFLTTIGAANTLTPRSDGVVVGAETTLISPTAATYGCSLGSDGQAVFAIDAGIPLVVKRSDDGSLVRWFSGTDNVGSVTVSSGVVTYGSFCGTHWSQFKALAKPNILRGTILETTDLMCEWDGKPDPALPQVRVALERSPRVYGVFSHWDEDSRDFHVASLGAFLVRMAPGSTPKRGELIESDANGLGVVQADDVFRASTVAKVTSGTRAEKYPDGSFLIPCTLHCG